MLQIFKIYISFIREMFFNLGNFKVSVILGTEVHTSYSCHIWNSVFYFTLSSWLLETSVSHARPGMIHKPMELTPIFSLSFKLSCNIQVDLFEDLALLNFVHWTSLLTEQTSKKCSRQLLKSESKVFESTFGLAMYMLNIYTKNHIKFTQSNSHKPECLMGKLVKSYFPS